MWLLTPPFAWLLSFLQLLLGCGWVIYAGPDSPIWGVNPFFLERLTLLLHLLSLFSQQASSFLYSFPFWSWLHLLTWQVFSFIFDGSCRDVKSALQSLVRSNYSFGDHVWHTGRKEETPLPLAGFLASSSRKPPLIAFQIFLCASCLDVRLVQSVGVGKRQRRWKSPISAAFPALAASVTSLGISPVIWLSWWALIDTDLRLYFSYLKPKF